MAYQSHLNKREREKAFFQFYRDQHWKTCLEDDCPTCEIFERYHLTTRAELRKLEEEKKRAKT